MDETSSTRAKGSVATSARTGTARQDCAVRLGIGNARAKSLGVEALAGKAELGPEGQDTPAEFKVPEADTDRVCGLTRPWDGFRLGGRNCKC